MSRKKTQHRKPAVRDEDELTNEITKDNVNNKHKITTNNSLIRSFSEKNITMESLARETVLKKRIDKIQAIAMLQSFKKIIR